MSTGGRTHYLYRLFTVDGELLYVGVSVEVHNRMTFHRAASEWFRHVDPSKTTTTDVGTDYSAALAAESDAIRDEQPLKNVVHSSSTGRALPGGYVKDEDVTTEGAAEILGTSARMVRYYVTSGRLAPAKAIGRSFLYKRTDVEALKPTLARRNWSKQVAS